MPILAPLAREVVPAVWPAEVKKRIPHMAQQHATIPPSKTPSNTLFGHPCRTMRDRPAADLKSQRNFFPRLRARGAWPTTVFFLARLEHGSESKNESEPIVPIRTYKNGREYSRRNDSSPLGRLFVPRLRRICFLCLSLVAVLVTHCLNGGERAACRLVAGP